MAIGYVCVCVEGGGGVKLLSGAAEADKLSFVCVNMIKCR